MEFKCVYDDCQVGHIDSLDTDLIADHFMTTHGSILMEITENEPLEVKLSYLKTETQENGDVVIPYLIKYKGLLSLLCASWENRFECWIYKLCDETIYLDGWKLEWKLTLKSTNKLVSDKDSDWSQDSVFMIPTPFADILNLKTDLSTPWMALYKNFFHAEENDEDGTMPFCIVGVAMGLAEPGPEPEPEVVPEVLETHALELNEMNHNDEINVSHLNEQLEDRRRLMDKNDYSFMCPNCNCVLMVIADE